MSIKDDDNIAGAGATAPRVTLADIEAAIASENTFIAGRAIEAIGQPVPDSTDLLTLCILTLKNGFVVIGKSAPASADNFDPEKGAHFAREDAKRQLWPLMGFALRDRLAAEAAAG